MVLKEESTERVREQNCVPEGYKCVVTTEALEHFRKIQREQEMSASVGKNRATNSMYGVNQDKRMLLLQQKREKEMQEALNWKPILYKTGDTKAVSIVKQKMTKKKKLRFPPKNLPTVMLDNTFGKNRKFSNVEDPQLERNRSVPKQPRASFFQKSTQRSSVFQIPSVNSNSTERLKSEKKSLFKTKKPPKKQKEEPLLLKIIKIEENPALCQLKSNRDHRPTTDHYPTLKSEVVKESVRKSGGALNSTCFSTLKTPAKSSLSHTQDPSFTKAKEYMNMTFQHSQTPEKLSGRMLDEDKKEFKHLMFQ
ncbi:unnamed protein product [Moneuplotes crassus]|uniref:Uncharacterized protein n=1 Tax=Euplotes crassus TaxID=5936 RepID=A0AAD1X7P5_EUPCR|nr:unnamed protein product [Moneuplotes crassus]